MKYKGDTGIIEIDEDSDALFGRVVGLREMIDDARPATEVVRRVRGPRPATKSIISAGASVPAGGRRL